MKVLTFGLALLVGCSSSTALGRSGEPLVLAPKKVEPFSPELALIDEMIEYVKKDIEKADRQKKRPLKQLARN